MPISSQPSASEINVELGRASNAPFSINGAEERALAGVPTGPISFNDFIGKSAAPTYADFLAWLDAQTGNTLGADLTLSSLNTNTSIVSKVTTFAESGSMIGSPFSQDSTGTFAVNTGGSLSRVMQHMCDSYAEFQAIVANGWACGMVRDNNFNFEHREFGLLRNNYQSSGTNTVLQLATDRIITYWWNGTEPRYRVHNAASQVFDLSSPIP